MSNTSDTIIPDDWHQQDFARWLNAELAALYAKGAEKHGLESWMQRSAWENFRSGFIHTQNIMANHDPALRDTHGENPTNHLELVHSAMRHLFAAYQVSQIRAVSHHLKRNKP